MFLSLILIKHIIFIKLNNINKNTLKIDESFFNF